MLRLINKRVKKLRKEFSKYVLENAKRFLKSQIINCRKWVKTSNQRQYTLIIKKINIR